MNHLASTDLKHRHCTALTKETPSLTSAEADAYLRGQADWTRDGVAITREFKFKNYCEAIAFVNAIAWISHREDHHPDLQVGFDRVRVSYSTHSVGGLSENDFICASKMNALFD